MTLPDLTDSELAAIFHEATANPELASLAEACQQLMEWAAPDGMPDVSDLSPWDRDALVERAKAKIRAARPEQTEGGAQP